MVSFDTNILVYATSAAPHAKMNRARDLVARGMQAGGSILLLQTLAEFSNVVIRKAGLRPVMCSPSSIPGERYFPCKPPMLAI